MATLDSNGVLFYQDTDNYTPIQTALNLAQSNLSNLLGGKPRFERTANTGTRAALVTSIGAGNISKASPLIVWRADAADGLQLEYTTNGTTWRTIADKEYYDAQDTGWVNVTVTGVTVVSPVQVRRIGFEVFWRGEVSASWTTGVTTVVASGGLPTQFRPADSYRNSGSALGSSGSVNAVGTVGTDGAMAIRALTAASGAVYLKGLSGYLVG